MKMKNGFKLRHTILLFAVGAFLSTSCSDDYDERITNLENAPKCYTTAEFQEFLKQEIAKQTTDQAELIKEHTGKISGILEELTGAKDRLGAAESDLTVLKGKSDNANEKLVILESALANAEKNIKAAADLAAKAEKDAKAAHDYAATLEGQPGSTDEKVIEAKQAADAAQAAADAAQADADALAQEVASAQADIEEVRKAAAAAKAAADKAQTDVNSLANTVAGLTASLNKLRDDLDSVIAEMQSNVAVRKVEKLANGDIKVTYKGTDGKEQSFTTSNVACSLDKTTGVATFTVNGDSFTIPVAKQFISSIVIVSETYLENKKQKINVVFNTTDGKVMDAVPNPASFIIYQGQTRSTALENTTLTIESIDKAANGPAQNEYEITFKEVNKDYTGLHFGWKAGTAQEVMSPAFNLKQIPVATKISFTPESGGKAVEIREQHTHSGTGCSNVPDIAKGSSMSFTMNIQASGSVSCESTEAYVLKFNDAVLNPIIAPKSMSTENDAKDRSYYIAYDIDTNGSPDGLDKSAGTAHSKGFDYDYYNGTKMNYIQDKEKIASLPAQKDSYFTINDIDINVTNGTDKFTIAVGNSAPNGLYAVVIMVKRTDGVYARGIAYLWVK